MSETVQAGKQDEEIQPQTSDHTASESKGRPHSHKKWWQFYKKDKSKDNSGASFLFCGVFRSKKHVDDDLRPVKQKKGKNVKGKVVFEQATNKVMWRNIVDKSIVGSGLITKAAICTAETGAICANNPEDFTPAVDQIKFLMGEFERPNKLVGKDIILAADRFRVISGEEDKVIYAKSFQPDNEENENPQPETGVAIEKTKTLIIIGVYPKSKTNDARKLMNEMKDYIEENTG